VAGFLLDTNVISELTRENPEPKVLAFLEGKDNLWLSSILIHKITYGLQLLPPGARRSRLSIMYASLLATFEDRVLTLDRTGAEWAAELRATARRAGYTLNLGDALVAGIARANSLALATRNVADFRPLDIEVIDPWETILPES